GETAPLVDPEHDATYQFSMNGTWSHSGSPIEDAVKEAGIAFSKAHNDALPTGAARLAPYLKKPLGPRHIQKVLAKNPPGGRARGGREMKELRAGRHGREIGGGRGGGALGGAAATREEGGRGFCRAAATREEWGTGFWRAPLRGGEWQNGGLTSRRYEGGMG